MIHCFKCSKKLDELYPDRNSIPLIDNGGLAKLEFGYGSKFDGGGSGDESWLDTEYHSVKNYQLAKVLASSKILIAICDNCFEENIDVVLAYNKKVTCEIERIQ